MGKCVLTNYIDIKKGGSEDPPLFVSLKGYRSHEVSNLDATIVAVSVNGESTETCVGTFCEWVSNNTIAGLEANLGLEGVLSNCTYHLERYIWAVEETCVIRGRTLISCNIVLGTSAVCLLYTSDAADEL